MKNVKPQTAQGAGSVHQFGQDSARHGERSSRGNGNGVATEGTEHSENGYTGVVSRATLCALEVEGMRKSGGLTARRTSTSQYLNFVASGRLVGSDRVAYSVGERPQRAARWRA